MIKTALNTHVFSLHGGEEKGSPLYLTVPSFDETGLVKHGFSTRIGGISTDDLGPLNLSFTRGDVHHNVRVNYELFCKGLGIDYRDLVFSDQTHTANCMAVTKRHCGMGFSRKQTYSDIDALMTNKRGVPLVTLFADCVPVLLLDIKTPAISAVHAGWRGTVGEIAKIAVKNMTSEYGTDPKNILAAIMPSIGKCCFEVGGEVAEEFEKVFVDKLTPFVERVNNGKSYIDMQGINRVQLINAGVLAENITVTDLCTKCNSDVFHSHRAAGDKRGSLAAIIELV